LALTELLRVHQQNNEQKDLIGSRMCQFPVRQLPKQANLLLGEEYGEGSLWYCLDTAVVKIITGCSSQG